MSSTPPAIESLPNEVLEAVFETGAHMPPQVIPHHDYPRQKLFSKFDYAPPFSLAISQVSRKWRKIALTSPTLWTLIYITRSLESNRHLGQSVGRSLDWVSLYLERSDGLPLHIIVNAMIFNLAKLPMDAVLFPVGLHSTRWKRFTLLVSHVGWLPQDLPALEHIDVPQLETMTIAADTYSDGIYAAGYYPLISTLPHLTTLRLKGVDIKWSGIALPELTCLELQYCSSWPTFGEFQEIVNGSPLLSRLVIQGDIKRLLEKTKHRHEKAVLALPLLRYLEIGVYHERQDRPDDVDVVGVLRLLHAPDVETLSLAGLTEREWRMLTGHLKLKPHTMPNVRALELSDIRSLCEVNYTDCEAFPRLTRLSLERVQCESLLMLLTEEVGVAQQWGLPVWAYLQVLAIRDVYDLDYRHLLRAVKGRRSRHRPKLRIGIDDVADPGSQWIGLVDEIREYAMIYYND